MVQLKNFLLLIVPFVLVPSWIHATEITVGADGNCILADAIMAANTDAATGGCPAGSGHDTITLETDVVLDDPQLVANARPSITSPITVEGQGHTIDGNDKIGYVLKLNEEYICDNGELILNNTTITGGNHAHPGDVTTGLVNNGGGIANARCGILTLNNSTVSGNRATGNGGGIFNGPQGIVTLNNSTISGNISEGNGGGGIYSDNGTVTLNNSTVSGNSAVGNGGGIYGVEINGPPIAASNITLNNSLLSGNTAANGNEIYHATGTITADSSNLFGVSDESNAEAFVGFTPGAGDVTATSDGTVPTALSAILSPLADNGGPTLTHALVPGSPAIDLDLACSTGLSEDQRGEPRPVGTGCDAGSFEASTSPANTRVFLSAIYLLLLNK